jgi:hypothetical protein
MKVTVHPLFQLIAEGEHQRQDFKYCINDSRKIARSLVAFANTDGGRLLVGVKDNGRIAGVRSEEEYYMVEAAARIYSRPAIPFEVQQWEVEGKTVLEINVEASKQRPHFAESDDKRWLAYIRKNDENILANNVLLKLWKLQNDAVGLMFTYDQPRKVLVTYLEQHGSITLSKFSRVAQISRMNAEDILAEFLKMQCIHIDLNHDPVQYLLNHSFDLTSFV